MLICIDSSALVVGLQGKDPSATKILELVGSDLNLIIPRLIAQEVSYPQSHFSTTSTAILSTVPKL